MTNPAPWFAQLTHFDLSVPKFAKATTNPEPKWLATIDLAGADWTLRYNGLAAELSKTFVYDRGYNGLQNRNDAAVPKLSKLVELRKKKQECEVAASVSDGEAELGEAEEGEGAEEAQRQSMHKIEVDKADDDVFVGAF